MNKYSVGTRVKINSNFPQDKDVFSFGMIEFVGFEGEIIEYTYTASDSSGWYTLDIDEGKYFWSEDVLEEVLSDI